MIQNLPPIFLKVTHNAQPRGLAWETVGCLSAKFDRKDFANQKFVVHSSRTHLLDNLGHCHQQPKRLGFPVLATYYALCNLQCAWDAGSLRPRPRPSDEYDVRSDTPILQCRTSQCARSTVCVSFIPLPCKLRSWEQARSKNKLIHLSDRHSSLRKPTNGNQTCSGPGRRGGCYASQE